MEILSPELTKKQYQRISRVVYNLSGISLGEGKLPLVKSRLLKRLRALGLDSYREYLDYLENNDNGQELSYMIDLLTTNKTSFFREIAHFEYLRKKVLPEMNKQRLRIWSAGCSSGEEPFSIAILLAEEIEEIYRKDIKILATDLSRRMLAVAKHGIYSRGTLAEVPKEILSKYFEPTDNGTNGTYRLKEEIRSLVKIAYLNLLNSWPMKGPFQIIFCRNVMIYFDRKTQERLVNRFYDYLAPGGYLFVGHSESLSGISHRFNYKQPAVYRKE